MVVVVVVLVQQHGRQPTPPGQKRHSGRRFTWCNLATLKVVPLQTSCTFSLFGFVFWSGGRAV